MAYLSQSCKTKAGQFGTRYRSFTPEWRGPRQLYHPEPVLGSRVRSYGQTCVV